MELKLRNVNDDFNIITATSGLELKTEETLFSRHSQFRQTGVRMLGRHIGLGGVDF